MERMYLKQSRVKSKISAYLRCVRLARGLTQREFAQALGYHAQFVANWENGRSRPPLKALHKISVILQIQPEALLTRMVGEYEKMCKKALKIK